MPPEVPDRAGGAIHEERKTRRGEPVGSGRHEVTERGLIDHVEHLVQFLDVERSRPVHAHKVPMGRHH